MVQPTEPHEGSQSDAAPEPARGRGSETEGMRVARNAAYLAGGSVAAMAFGFFGRVLVADRLGDDFGLIVGAQGFVLAFLPLVQFGLHPLLVREFASGRGDPDGLLGATLLVRVFLGVAYAVVVPIAAVATGYLPGQRWLLVVFVGVELLGILAETYSALCEGFERMARAALIDMARPIATFLGVATALFAGGTVEAFAMGYLGARLCQAALAAVLGHTARRGLRPRFAFARLLPLLREARWFAAMGLIAAANGSLAVMVLTRFSTIAETARYGAALVFLELVMIFPVQVQRALLPAFSRLTSTGGATGMAHNSLRVVPIALFPAAAGLALLAEPILGLYPSGSFGGAAPALAVMGLWLLIMAPGHVAGTYLTGVGRIRALVLINLAGLALQAAFQVGLAPRHGALGAALAVLISYTLVSLLSMMATRDDGVRVPWAPWLRILAATAVMSAAVYPVREMALWVSVPVGVAVYAAAFFLLLPSASFERRAIALTLDRWVHRSA